jgi:hypothetical protein
MFDSAEIGHRIDRATYKAEVPALRAALLDAQYELLRRADRAVVVLINASMGQGAARRSTRSMPGWTRATSARRRSMP